MKGLYLDASTTAVGFVYDEDGRVVLSGAYEPQGEDWLTRVMDFESWLATKHFVDRIGYEIPTGNRGNMSTNRKLGAVEYVILRFCRQAQIECIGVTASQVKATEIDKDHLEYAAAVKGGPLNSRRPGDEADALGVWSACQRDAR